MAEVKALQRRKQTSLFHQTLPSGLWSICFFLIFIYVYCPTLLHSLNKLWQGYCYKMYFSGVSNFTLCFLFLAPQFNYATSSARRYIYRWGISGHVQGDPKTSQELRMLSLSLFIQGSLWMLRLLFSIAKNVISFSKVTSLYDCSLRVFFNSHCLCLFHCNCLCHSLFVGQVISPHHSDQKS